MISSIVTVRTKSSRLPQKCLLPFGEATVIHHVLTRCKAGGLRPILCTTTDTSDDILIEICEELGVEYFRGPELNKLQRWRDCCREFDLDAFHSVDADDPFFCSDEVKRSYAELNNGFDMVEPSRTSASGGATVGYSLKSHAVEAACKGLNEGDDTEMMWAYVKAVPNLKVIQLSEPSQDAVTVRMTLDYQEDYIFLSSILALLGPNATRAEINGLLARNPDLEKINAFRNDEWAHNQSAKVSIAEQGLGN